MSLKKTPTTSSLDIAIMRSRHVMVGEKATKELWGMPRLRKKIRGTSVEDDVIELEGVLSSSHVFEHQITTKMDDDYFWKVIKIKRNVGSVRDRDKSTVPYSEHELGVIGRLVRGETPDDTERDDDDDLSTASNDESICPNRSEGVTMDNNSDSDDDEEVTDDQRATKSALALKKLGNMSRKKLDVNATKDITIIGNLLIKKKLGKSRQKSLSKQQKKRKLIFDSMKYFSAQMDERRKHLTECSKRSADPTTAYEQPSWKLKYKEYMQNNIS